MKPSNVDEDVDVDSACTAEDPVLRCISRPFKERRGPSRKHESQRAVALPLPRMREVHRYSDPAAWHRGRPPVRIRAVMPAQRVASVASRYWCQPGGRRLKDANGVPMRFRPGWACATGLQATVSATAARQARFARNSTTPILRPAVRSGPCASVRECHPRWSADEKRASEYRPRRSRTGHRSRPCCRRSPSKQSGLRRFQQKGGLRRG